MLEPCKNMTEDAQELADWAGAFLHPKVLIETVKYNAAHNAAKLGINVAKAKTAYAAGHWFKFGDDVGDLLALVTKTIPSESNSFVEVTDFGNLTSIQYNEVVAGVVFGVIKKNDAVNIQACIVSEKAVAIEVY